MLTQLLVHVAVGVGACAALTVMIWALVRIERNLENDQDRRDLP